MAKVKVLAGSFDKIDATFSKTEGFIFISKTGKLTDIVIMNPEKVACTYYADPESRPMTRPDVSEELRAAYEEARRTLPHPAGKDVVVIFKDGRWTYVRAETKRDAIDIHQLNSAQDDRPPPPLNDPDDRDETE
jgi:hypothetical protein